MAVNGGHVGTKKGPNWGHVTKSVLAPSTGWLRLYVWEVPLDPVQQDDLSLSPSQNAKNLESAPLAEPHLAVCSLANPWPVQRRYLAEPSRLPSLKPWISGKKEQHKRPKFPADIPDPYARTPRGQKFLLGESPGPRENPLFGADVPRFLVWTSMTWRVLEKICAEEVCIDFFGLLNLVISGRRLHEIALICFSGFFSFFSVLSV